MLQNSINNEQRRYDRYPCNILVHFDGYNQSGVGILTDVSRAGARLTCRPARKLIAMVRISAFNQNPMANLNSTTGFIAWQSGYDEFGQTQVGLLLKLEKAWLEKALVSDADALSWDCPRERLDLVMGY
jgi:hypothetical protein